MNHRTQNTHNELVSIIIPTFNRAHLLRKCIDSILEQTHKNVEIIVINDGSVDDTETVIKELNDERIVYLKLNKNGNLSELRNIGILVSRGSIIAFCDDDDLWCPEKLTLQLEMLKKTDICCTNAELMNSSGVKLGVNYANDFKNDLLLNTKHLFLKNFIITSSIVIRKSILEKVSFNTQKYKNIAEDYDLWVRLSLDNDILFINQSLVYYRIHDSLTHNQGNDHKLYSNSIDILNKYSKAVSSKDEKYASIGKFKFHFQYFKFKWRNHLYLQGILELLSIVSLFLNFKNVVVLFKYKCSNNEEFLLKLQNAK